MLKIDLEMKRMEERREEIGIVSLAISRSRYKTFFFNT